jgi:hypothetical protein
MILCSRCTHKLAIPNACFSCKHTFYDNKVRELIAGKVLHTSLLNITVVAFKVLPLGSYAPIPAPSPTFKTILELVFGMAFRAAVVLLLFPSIFPLSSGTVKSHWGLDPVKKEGVPAQLFVY